MVGHSHYHFVGNTKIASEERSCTWPLYSFTNGPIRDRTFNAGFNPGSRRSSMYKMDSFAVHETIAYLKEEKLPSLRKVLGFSQL